MSNHDDDKAPSLDVFILTFNAGKARINPSILALHLRNAFAQNATDLPELVVISLQEMAPLEHSFIGSYMINPYFQSWVSAVNLAASPPDDTCRNQGPSELGSRNGLEDGSEDRYQDEFQYTYRSQDEIGDAPYTLIATRHIGMTGILLFSRDPSALDNLKSTEVGFGAGELGNKGAVGLRMLFSKEDAKGRKRQTELTFVGAHLAAHEWNLEKRNKNWESIVSGLLFDDPRQFYDGESTHPTPPISANDDESQALLSQSPHKKKLHDITIYKPGSHLFVAGDLNYRISKTSPTPHSVFPRLDPESPNFYGRYLALDQLALEKAAGRTLHGLSEAPITFPPTYKLDYEIEGKSEAGARAHCNDYPHAHDEVFWKWASHRWPGWCDRVLYLDTPSSIAPGMAINTIAYNALPPVRSSDHRAVFLRLSVPVVEPSILVPSPDFCVSNSEDPRVKLPYPIDFESWEHRTRVKKWERVIGWSMLVSHSKQGISIFVTLFFICIGVWWLRSRDKRPPSPQLQHGTIPYRVEVEMTERAPTNYVEHSRHLRRIELAKLARDRQADVSIVVGLSWRLRGHQAHVDYTGGLDTARIHRSLASLGGISWSKALPRFLHTRDDSAGERVGKGRIDAESAGPQSEDWRDALVHAAPVDIQRPDGYRRSGETRDAHGERIRAEYERKLRSFASVLASVDTLALAHLARDLLEQRRARRDADPMPLPRIEDPFFGGGHVFYVIRFPRNGTAGQEERIQWIAKIPAAAGDNAWDQLRCEALRSEAFLLHLLRQEGVPVPEVIDADCRPGNVVGVPWLLMEFVQGRRFEEVWFSREGGDVVCQARREEILRNVARIMLKLGKFEFDTGGALVFDRSHGELVRTATGPLFEKDVKAMVLRWFVDEECEYTPLYCRTGPWERTNDMYTALLDAWPPDTVSERGIDALLRLLLGLVREPGERRPSTERCPSGIGARRKGNMEASRIKRFVLTHPNLSMRHILLAEDGTTIKAIFGWDGARAAPRSIGNEALPRWLVRDFDPFVWRWKPGVDFWRPDHAPPECNRFEDPPWVLRELRGFYASVMGELKRGKRRRERRRVRKKQEGTDAIRVEAVGGEDVDVDITKQSLLTLTLDTAIRDPRCRTAALRRVLEKCSRSFEELDFDLFVDTLGKGFEIDTLVSRSLANNVRELLDKGFVKGAIVW
ncbi:hypothetical protein GQX73_g2642 [Xylaria multiplex]|uniref:Inositol polyphosphate-related phosphatase domain-containing protein n=1 Tax=Xylaria multiplex TaxID=323545 RepID=A0A7C8MUT5_9PEZI|nr:hypothetical protein GQX73_g2642 [Xylaria multiplex]